jgi:xanthine dehydrogenase molybdopterin-binding subunit B
VRGEFEYSSDLWMDGMLYGATLRSPHPHANIWSIDVSEAEAMRGVYAVLTHEDVPGRKVYGMEIPDQPVLAWEKVRYQGEPVAIVAADHPETARRALEKIRVDYEVLEPVTSAEDAMRTMRRGSTSPATCSGASRSCTESRRTLPPTWSSPASTRSGCRTRRSSVPSPGSRCRTGRAGWTSTSRPSGCT